MTLDGFLPNNDNVSMQWVINHKNGFLHWQERCSSFILPHSILDLLCEKGRRDDSFTYLAEIRDLESLELLRGLFLYNLVDELIIYLLPFSTGQGTSVLSVFSPQQWQLHKTASFSNGVCRLIYRKPRKK